MKLSLGLGLLALAAAATAQLTGQMYVDFYSAPRHHDKSVEGKAGFWVRRLYVTYTHEMKDGLTGRIRFEAKDPGDFSTVQAMQPFLKDAWIRWKKDGQQVMIGLIPTPAFEEAEERLGYRPIERTPLDLYRFANSRDKGISFRTALGTKANATLMVGDASGTKSSNGQTHAVYARLGMPVSEGLVADLYGDWSKKGVGQTWSTVKGELFWQKNGSKAGLMLAAHRQKGTGPAYNVTVASLYGEAKGAFAGWTPFARLDLLSNSVPEGDKVEYMRLSKTGKPTLVILGVRREIFPDIELAPSLTWVKYRSTGAPAPSSDVFLRLTMSAKF